MKKVLIIAFVIIPLIILALCYFEIIELDINFAHKEKASEKNIIENSITKTIKSFVAKEQHPLLDKKITILNIWGLGCAPCIEELPLLNNLNKLALNYTNVACLSFCSGADTSMQKSKQATNQAYKFDFLPIVASSGIELSILSLIARNARYRDVDSNVQVLPTTLVYNQMDSMLFFKSGKLSENDISIITTIIKGSND